MVIKLAAISQKKQATRQTRYFNIFDFRINDPNARSVLQSIVAIILKSVLMLLAVGIATSGISSEKFTVSEIQFPGIGDMATVVLIYPFMETFCLQAIPIEACRSACLSRRTQVCASILAFMLCHLANGTTTAFAAGLVGGLCLALVYVHNRDCSIRLAFGGTLLVHSSINIIILVIKFIFLQ